MSQPRRLSEALEDIDIHSAMVHISDESAPWQYARSPILSVCRALGAFFFVGVAS